MAHIRTLHHKAGMLTRTIPNLQPGQKVGIANCVDRGTVVERCGPNLYVVEYKGHHINMQRQLLTPRN